MSVILNNFEKAVIAWGDDMPGWIAVLAREADKSSQRRVADQMGKSSGYISRIINSTYTGSYDEAEIQVRSIFAHDKVICPLWGPIPLTACIRNRRYRGPLQHQAHHQYARTCPTCAHNTDIEGEGI